MYLVKRVVFILLLVLAASCGKIELIPDRGNTTLGMPERIIPVLPEDGSVPEVRITVKEKDWQALLDAFNKENRTQNYIPVDITYKDGKQTKTVNGAGLRLKGNTSRRYPGKPGEMHHVHFGLHLSEYTQGQELLGQSRLDLKWFKDDPAYCREVYCYDLFQRYGVWTAINAGYARLWITIGGKETYMGVYELMEHIRGDYVKRRASLFGGRQGHLWKARYGADFKDANAWMGADDNKNDYTYELKSDAADFENARAQLKDFISKLNSLNGKEFYTWAEENIDVPLLLKTYAVNVAVGMWDDYWNNSNNYYFYFNPGGKFFFIPYDYDNTLGTSSQCGVQNDSGRQDPLKWGHQSYPLLNKILGNPEWKAYYISCLKELCDGDFDAEESAKRIKQWQEVISPYVSNDTGEDMEIKDRPAGWGNHSEYRILEKGSNNFFKVKAEVMAGL